MNTPASNSLVAKSKRKFSDLNNSNSSENSASPSPKPLCKVIKSTETRDMGLTKEDLQELRADLKSDMEAELKEQLVQCLNPLLTKVSKLEKTIEMLDKRSRSKNLIIHGLPVLDGETSTKLIGHLNSLWVKLGISQQIILDDVYRLGSRLTSGSRPVIVKFLRTLDKKLVLSKRIEATKCKVFINDDCTPLEQFHKKLLNTHLKAMKEADDTTWGSIRGNSLHVKKNGQPTRKFAVENGTVKEL
jgi:hypothetical protein